MLKKTITYDNIDGESVTEDFYFNLTKAEIVEMQLSVPGEGGLHDRMVEAVQSGNQTRIIYYLKMLVGTSYGRRSGDDNKRFVKKDSFSEEFFASEAYSELFMSFFTDPDAAAEFVNNVMPANLVKEANELKKTQDIETVMGLPAEEVLATEDPRPAWQRENRAPTKKELTAMSPEQLQEAFRTRLENNN